MAFLTLGGTDLEVQHQGAGSGDPTYIGEQTRAFDGSLRTGVRGKKRSWSFTLIPMTHTAANAVRTLVGNDAAVNLTGDVVGGATIAVTGRVGSASFIPDGTASGFLEVLALALLEV